MRKIYLTLFVLFFGLAAFAQGINQSVQVTNKYESQLSDTKKMGPEISAPDSLFRFDYKFDYSVFDTDYRGAYEFSPYLIEMKPDASLYDGKKGRLVFGAGYTLHPELDFVYVPVRKEKTAVSVHAGGRGFLQSGNDYDFSGSAGVDGRFIGKHCITKVGISYDGVFNGSWQAVDNMNSAAALLSVKSLRNGSFFFYDINLGYRYLTSMADFFGSSGQNGQIVSFKGSAGPVFRNKYRILVDVEAKLDLESGYASKNGYMVAVTPHIMLLPGQFHADLGARIDYTSALSISPVAEVGVKFANGSHYIYAGFSGGQQLIDSYELKSSNHRYNLLWNDQPCLIEREKMNAFAGLNGCFGKHFQYRLKGGFCSWGNRLFETLGPAVAGYTQQDFNAAYASLNASWENDSVSMLLDTGFTIPAGELALGFAPALAIGSLSLDYKWQKRIRAGVTVEGSTKRLSYGMPEVEDIPAFADVSVNFRYNLSSRFGVWAKGGNLACMKIQRVPGFVEEGPYGTAGISVIF